MYTKRLFALFFLLALGLGGAVSSYSYQDSELPPVTLHNISDLRDEARLARDGQRPIMILFSMRGCPWCSFVEEDFLKPMLRNERYRSQFVIRRVMTDSYANIIDFNGEAISPDKFASRYRASLTPTLVFIDHKGNVIAPTIRGVINTEFYGYDLEQGMEISRQKMKKLVAMN